MTNEEFTGHLMAAMHGPQATEIALRIVHVLIELASTDAVQEEIAAYVKAHGSLTDRLAEVLGVPELHSTVFTLSLLALAMNHVPRGERREKVKSAMTNAATRRALVDMLRTDMQGSLGRDHLVVDDRITAIADLVYPEGSGG